MKKLKKQRRCHEGGGYSTVGQREDLCRPHVGSAQRCGVISLTLWLFGRKQTKQTEKRKINKCDKRLGGQESSQAASRRIRPLDYGASS